MESNEEELLVQAKNWNLFIKCLIENHIDAICSICIDN